MKQPAGDKEQQLLQKLTRGDRTNFLEWFERIVDEFYEERVVNERVSVHSIKERVYNDLTEQFLCSLLTLFFKFFIKRGANHIVEPCPLLITLPTNTNYEAKQKEWEKFVQEREWEYFLNK